ncbi:hypothetical protein F4861DRAFT_112701 [Xylaria intraflava]|nr:hypothetical protein F4861DRAFT_112701 [Xylaria intraflava]
MRATQSVPVDGRGNDGSLSSLLSRQWVEGDDGEDVWFWYTTPGIIIKYVIFLVLVLLLAGWIIGGRVHAKRRLRKGLKPLGYHAFLLSRSERAQVDPAYSTPPVYGVYRPVYGNGGEEYYGMQPMPPPVYDPSRPPVYDGPPTGSKVDPVQSRQATAAEGPADYAPPPGPPPGTSRR